MPSACQPPKSSCLPVNEQCHPVSYGGPPEVSTLEKRGRKGQGQWKDGTQLPVHRPDSAGGSSRQCPFSGRRKAGPRAGTPTAGQLCITAAMRRVSQWEAEDAEVSSPVSVRGHVTRQLLSQRVAYESLSFRKVVGPSRLLPSPNSG